MLRKSSSQVPSLSVIEHALQWACSLLADQEKKRESLKEAVAKEKSLGEEEDGASVEAHTHRARGDPLKKIARIEIGHAAKKQRPGIVAGC